VNFHPFSILNIMLCDMIHSMEGFICTTELDLKIIFYHIKQDSDAQKLCTVVIPWRKYNYKGLNMGIKIA
jgi:hypothetical protein